MLKPYKIYHLTWNGSSIRSKPYFINDCHLSYWLTLMRITGHQFMEKAFSNGKPYRSTMRRFCDFLRNIADRSIADHNIAELQDRKSVACGNHPSMCFLRNAICEMRYRISVVWGISTSVMFEACDVMRVFWYVVHIAISQLRILLVGRHPLPFCDATLFKEWFYSNLS